MRKNEILDTAEELFARKGYEKTTIKDILETNMIAKGTFYYYFQSKEELMDAVVGRFIERGVEQARAISADPTFSIHQKIFYILSPPDMAENKAEIIEQLHALDNERMHLRSIR